MALNARFVIVIVFILTTLHLHISDGCCARARLRCCFGKRIHSSGGGGGGGRGGFRPRLVLVFAGTVAIVVAAARTAGTAGAATAAAAAAAVAAASAAAALATFGVAGAGFFDSVTATTATTTATTASADKVTSAPDTAAATAVSVHFAALGQ